MAGKKLTLPTITVAAGGRTTTTDETYDFEWLSRQNIKHWMKNGVASPERCALYSDDQRDRFIHIALKKEDLEKRLVELGIIEVIR
jgi:hypothetical protein